MRVRALATWTLGSFVLAILLAAAIPYAFGARSMVVLSGSMTPTIRTGDVVVVQPIRPTDAAVGDIVTFQAPDGSDKLLVHRVRAVAQRKGKVYVTTQGDANTTQEHWKVPVDGTIGSVAYRIPMLGFASGWISSPAGRIGLLILPGLALIVSFLARIWRPAPRPEGLP